MEVQSSLVMGGTHSVIARCPVARVSSAMIFEWASSFPPVDKYLREEMPKVVDVAPIAHYMWRLALETEKTFSTRSARTNHPTSVRLTFLW